MERWIRGALPILAIAVVGCSGNSRPTDTRLPSSPPSRRVVGTFEGTVSEAGLRLTSVTPAGGLASALTEVPVVQDGRAGSNPPNTLEMVTLGAGIVPAGCGAFDSFEADVRIQSFFPKAFFQNVWVEIISMTPAGRESCNGVVPPDGSGLSAAFGLFPYGNIDRAGLGWDTALGHWSFRLPDTQPFTFRGRVMADVFSDEVAPTSTPQPPGGSYPGPFAFFVMCEDGELLYPYASGCVGTHYTLDGSEPTLDSPQVGGGFTISENTTVRYFSVDAFGNAEAPQSVTYVIDAVPPKIASSSPAAYATGVDPATSQVSVTFDEPMLPTTAEALQIVPLAGGPYPSSGWVQSPDGRTFTVAFADGLTTGAVFQITVSGRSGRVQDLAGNPLLADVLLPFQVGPPLRYAGPAGHSHLVNAGLAFDPASVFSALALWTDTTGAGTRLCASAAGGQRVCLDTVAGAGASLPAWSATTALGGHLVVWSANGKTRAAWFPPLAPTPAWTADLWDAESPEGSIAISPTKLWVLRADGGVLEGRMGAGDGSFSPPVVLSTDARWPAIVEEKLAPPGAKDPPRLRASYVTSGGTIETIWEDFTRPSGWSLPAAVPGSGDAPIAGPPLLLYTWPGSTLVWATSDGAIRTATDDGAGFGPWLELGAYPSVEPLRLAGAGGGGAAVVWVRDGLAFGAVRLAGGTWGPVDPLFSAPVESVGVVALSGAFSALGLAADGGFSNPLERWDAPFAFNRFSPQGTVANYPPGTAGLQVAAAHTIVLHTVILPEGPAERLLSSYDSSWNYLPIESVSSGSEARYAGASALPPPMMAGEGYWIQEEHGIPHPVFGQFDTGGPGAATALYEVARFGAVVEAAGPPWYVQVQGPPTGTPPGIPDSLAATQEWTTTRVSDFPASAQPPVVASRAGSALLSWVDGGSIWVGGYVPGAGWIGPGYEAQWVWPPASPAGLSVSLGYVDAQGSCGALAWRYASPAGPRPVVRFAGWGGCSAIPDAEFDRPVGPGGPRVAPGELVFVDEAQTMMGITGAVAWENGGTVEASALDPAVPVWPAPVAISPPGLTCGDPQIATVLRRSVAVFDCGELYAAVFDGAAWRPAFRIAGASRGFKVAGNAAGFRVVAALDDAGTSHLFSMKVDENGATAPVRLDDGTGDVRPDFSLVTFPFGDAPPGFLCAGWSQTEDDPIAARARFACYF